ncbi:type I-E CRISPR-associated protein Cas7/Cse4/CasC [Lactiplantibacillus daowaiensis]|uniref:Type I-E CRISPR-associated protein Cas7/Cse4/CasC n=1 Tax=Lactiplantibacillus daowaiensis TaxID=2559918 RepID=A0ABW1RZX7_9LACO|nr:type I-E CRISPR-associated protein Cas7/Cse4/CasC [Lactiplantibacillus daowaiensis]
MADKNLYIDLNVLQTVPSSNLNRDDTGAPKTALYGSVNRARVSSQSWKRAIREAFKQDDISTGVRTKDVVAMLVTALKRLNPALNDEDAMSKADEILIDAKIKNKNNSKNKNKDKQLDALLFTSPGQIAKVAQYATDNEKLNDKELKDIWKHDQSLDLALFGRMVANNPELNVDASAQVAHAISTHEVIPEFDYFTALDDRKPEDTNGAAMLGSIAFNSATLYRYANLNMNELVKNLNSENAIKGAVAFIKDFILSMPTGKQNTFANKTLPSYVMITIRTDTPVNLVSAFEEPVAPNNGYIKPSIVRFEDEYETTLKLVERPLQNWVLSKQASKVGDNVANLSELLNKITTVLSEVTQNENIND